MRVEINRKLVYFIEVSVHNEAKLDEAIKGKIT